MAINMKPFTEQAALFARISEIAYLDAPEGPAKFAELGFIAELVDVNGSQAYWLQSKDDLVIACRGTQPTDFRDIAADLKAAPVKSSQGINFVHLGFKQSADNVWAELSANAKKYGKKRTVWCTGHSLGAAMATLIAYKLQRSEDCPNPQALFTYGSPRTGNKEYIKAMEDSGLLHFRFVNNADIVARVPVWPYKHFGGMYYLNHYGNLRALTFKQLCKDIWRGFIVGIKKKDINFFSNHSITNYAERLERWTTGVEYPQE
jgi:triacylglycerol lipase